MSTTLDYPASPTVGQTYIGSTGAEWVWDGVKWNGPGISSTSVAYLPLAGGTMTGPITLSADPVAALQPVTLQYYNTHLPAGSGSVTSVVAGTGLSGGTITVAGTIALGAIVAHDVLANATGSTAVPTGTSLSAVIDGAIGATQGNILYRSATAWTALGVGTLGQFLQTGGSGGNISWANGNAGTVTQINTGGGLGGGPITTSGTITLVPITASSLFGNSGTVSASPAAVAIGSGLSLSTAGTLSATGSGGTVTQINTSGAGINASPATITGAGTLSVEWNGGTVSTLGSGVSLSGGTLSATGLGGSVTSITAGTGLTGGTITTAGTLAIAASGVTAGSYSNTNLTVDATGRITTASNGTGGAGAPTIVTVNGTGTTQSGATPISADYNIVGVVSGTNNAFILSGALAVIRLINPTGTDAQVFPQVGSQLWTLGVNNATTVPAFGQTTFVQQTSTQWVLAV